jgi:8-oxo-dGTP pyrophosphatase MutT (NUDIX family)
MATRINKKVQSSGGLVIRVVNGEWVTLLVGSGTPLKWRIPKGMVEKGETLEQTAVREVKEETGLTSSIIKIIGTAEWTYLYNKEYWDETVFFYLLGYIGGNTDQHDKEFDEVKWVPIEIAAKILFYPSEAVIAVNANKMLANCPVSETTDYSFINDRTE